MDHSVGGACGIAPPTVRSARDSTEFDRYADESVSLRAPAGAGIRRL